MDVRRNKRRKEMNAGRIEVMITRRTEKNEREEGNKESEFKCGIKND